MPRPAGRRHWSPPIVTAPASIPPLKRDRKSTGSVKRHVESFLDDSATPTFSDLPPKRKRKRVSEPAIPSKGRRGSKANPLPLSDQEASDALSTPKTKSRRGKESKTAEVPIEKRLRRYRTKPTQTFLTKLSRARTQRMIVLSRTRISELEENIDIVGSTGNIYTVTIGQLPSCTCPDHLKGNECKHKVYALHTVLRAPEDLVYQLALLSEELETIFTNAPPIPTEAVSAAEKDSEGSNKRKPIEEGTECPICYMDMLDTEQLVWCKAACGNNMHKSCFDQWATSQRGQTVKCVYCRTPWQPEKGGPGNPKAQGTVGIDGYVNVAAQFGLDVERDTSSYNEYWVRRQRRYGHWDHH